MAMVPKAHTPAEATALARVTPLAHSPALCATPYCRYDIGGTAIHQEWNGPVRYDKAALPGEIVYLFGTGFGPVEPAIATATSAATDSLFVATTPLECNALLAAIPAQTDPS